MSLEEGIWEPVFCSNFNMRVGSLTPLHANSDGRSAVGSELVHFQQAHRCCLCH